MKSSPKPTASLKRATLVPLDDTSTSWGTTLVSINSTEAGERMRTPSSTPLFRIIWQKRA